ncbi:PcfJ domain-containing protein [Anaerobacillus sp. HL2]|nr:PcfJ domain-containing protein [Anaerobacillus sp. HL2]
MQKEAKHHTSITNTLISWKDYLEECIELGMDLTSESVLLPNSLHNAHQQTTRSIKMKKDEEINKKIASLQPKLVKHYWFETDDSSFARIASSIELFDEGEALNHCVGRYAERYAKGEICTNVYSPEITPDKSFYTLELSLGMMQVTQCRGFENRDTTNEVKQFVEAFKAEKLVKKSNRRKVASKERAHRSSHTWCHSNRD